MTTHPVPSEDAARRLRKDPRRLERDELRGEIIKAVARFVSAKTGHDFAAFKWEEHYLLLKRKDRKSLCVAVGAQCPGAYLVRGLLRVTRPTNWSFFSNGQAARGTVQVEHWGEGDDAWCDYREWGSERLRSHEDWEDEFFLAIHGQERRVEGRR